MATNKDTEKVEQTVDGLAGSEPVDPQPTELEHCDQVADGTTGGPDDAPVRTSRPDVPIIGSLAIGAGQHKPTAHSSDVHDPASGRYTPDEPPHTALQDEKVTREGQKQADAERKAAEKTSG